MDLCRLHYCGCPGHQCIHAYSGNIAGQCIDDAPVASAMRITSSFKQLMIVSVIFGETAVIIGLFLSFHLNISPGGTIVLVSILILLGTILLNRLGVSRNGSRAQEV